MILLILSYIKYLPESVPNANLEQIFVKLES